MMARSKPQNKKIITRSNDDVVEEKEGEKDPKRRRMTSVAAAAAAASSSVKKEEKVVDSDRSNNNLSTHQADVPDPVASATGSNTNTNTTVTATTTNDYDDDDDDSDGDDDDDDNDDDDDDVDNNNDNDNNELPTPVQLSEVYEDDDDDVDDDGDNDVDDVNDNGNGNGNGNNELPTPVQLSKVLRTIVSKRYSRDETLHTLERLCKWTRRQDPDFLQSFNIHAGILKVLDFLKATLKDVNCVGTVRMKCIKKSAYIVMGVCCPGEDDSYKDITTKIATSAINYNGIVILINASEEHFGDNINALACVWGALVTITDNRDAMKNAFSKIQTSIIFDMGIHVVSQLKSYDFILVSNALAGVFQTLGNVVRSSDVEKRHFQNNNIVSKFVDVFGKDGTYGDRSEKVTEAAIYFFNCCHKKNILDSADCEIILPFLAMALKFFGSHQQILSDALDFISDACDTIGNKKIIERSGVIEPLGALLVSNNVNEEQKMYVREVIVCSTLLSCTESFIQDCTDIYENVTRA